MADDIVDRIDKLVSEQMAGGEPNYLSYSQCPHCGRDWHGFPYTLNVLEMHLLHVYDPGYSIADDGSQVLCAGSTFIGPQPEQPLLWVGDPQPYQHTPDQSRLLGLIGELDQERTDYYDDMNEIDEDYLRGLRKPQRVFLGIALVNMFFLASRQLSGSPSMWGLMNVAAILFSFWCLRDNRRRRKEVEKTMRDRALERMSGQAGPDAGGVDNGEPD